jgi:hypothetical protein
MALAREAGVKVPRVRRYLASGSCSGGKRSAQRRHNRDALDAVAILDDLEDFMPSATRAHPVATPSSEGWGSRLMKTPSGGLTGEDELCPCRTRSEKLRGGSRGPGASAHGPLRARVRDKAARESNVRVGVPRMLVAARVLAALRALDNAATWRGASQE